MNKRGLSPEMIAIILLVVGLAIIAMVFIYLATQGRIFLGNTTQLSINYT